MLAKTIISILGPIVIAAMLSACGQRSDGRDKIDPIDLAVDSLARKYNGVKLKTTRASFSYKIENECSGKLVASQIFLRDIVKENDSLYVLIGFKTNSIFKIDVRKSQLNDIEQQNTKPVGESIIVFSKMKIKKIYHFDIEYDEFDHAGIGFDLAGNRYLITGSLVEYKNKKR